jgi:hypothetical protein
MGKGRRLQNSPFWCASVAAWGKTTSQGSGQLAALDAEVSWNEAGLP